MHMQHPNPRSHTRPGNTTILGVVLIAFATCLAVWAVRLSKPPERPAPTPTPPTHPAHEPQPKAQPSPGFDEGIGGIGFEPVTLIPDAADGNQVRAILLNALQIGEDGLAIAAINRLTQIDYEPAPQDRYHQHAAVRHNRIAAIEHMHGLGIKLNARDNAGRLPIHTAAALDNPDMIRLLIEHAKVGPDLHAQTDGATPLIIAATTNATQALRALIDLGAQINATTPAGKAPLHAAAAHGNDLAVRILIQHGADPTARYKGKAAYELAQDAGYTTIATLLSPTPGLRRR